MFDSPYDSSRHLSDADVVRYIDKETSLVETEAMQAHLADCSDCSLRIVRAEETFHAIDEVHHSQAIHAMPESAQLRARLQQAIAVSPRPRPWWGQLAPRLAVAALVLFAVAVGIYQSRTTLVGPHNPGPLPDRSLTPGSIRPVTFGEVCDSNDDDLDPDVPASMKRAVLKEYGLGASSTDRKYQIDYLVNPQLGGTNDIRNLWPQPYTDDVWNAQAKDKLEKTLHQMVCDQTVDLAEAQREIETDWIAAYKKYIRQQDPAQL